MKSQADNIIDAAQAIIDNARKLAESNDRPRHQRLSEAQREQILLELRHDLEDALKSLKKIEAGER
jgi:hypothetical protein